MHDLVSVIIPVYGRFDIFQKALASVLAQNYRPLEIIVVDDGNAVPPPVPQCGFDEQCSYLLLKESHRGAPAARNAGFHASHGSFVIFWDADVIAKPSLLARLVEALEKNPNASYAYADFLFGFKKMRAGSFDPERLKEKNYITTTSLIRREDFFGFDESLKRFQDWDLWLSLLGQGKKGVYIPQTLFRVVSGGTMSSWLPTFLYQSPWKYIPGIRHRVSAYEEAREIILKKHHEIGEKSDMHR